ncbi:TROVE domain-containing protein [Marinitenerispora sediminis]|uniref:TROVE domain-containing protein n=1 Tax=Marinitenerispora sediminis TaxID=1931232 RepID=A0A368T9H5_9ACTN|nr:TROVE domain-containing protein [Marinitenerispora sediminis]RCV51108.1 TROVE domain-containing protein [Marinitenerispora sediminis]RCV54622.1 TROVE domain-containing protein [Marinitenerispora sediminis]RCV61192.1 TROVE domain-containing protein [Marinitenerispora sediminis]
MSKFNTAAARSAGRGPVVSERVPSGQTHEGGPGYARDDKSELFLLAVSNMVGEQTFYEAADARDERFRALVHQIAVADPEWLLGMIGWLRGTANMRSAALVAALEGARARVAAGAHGHSRQMVAAALQRADEPGEALAYWTSRYGRAIPKPVKRGVADALRRLYTERALLKYDTGTRGWRFADVIELVHPAPAADRAAWQGDLFAHALDRRHGRDAEIPASLGMVRARAELAAVPAERRRRVLAEAPERLAQAGMTWEALAGWLQGPMDAAAWEAAIPSMGYMALLRNLRNFDEAGVSDAVAERVALRLADPAEVARSRQLPMRFLAAHRATASLRWAGALERALGHCLGSVPALPGRTLILVDQSYSMSARLSRRSYLTCSAAAQVFGAALALRAEHADLVQYDAVSEPVAAGRGDAVLRVVERFWGPRGGTSTADAVRRHYRRHDRVVIVTDEQAHHGQDPAHQVPAEVPVYTWNLAGYRHGHGPSGEGNRHVFGGLGDAAFAMVPLIEAGRRAGWPWES